MAVFSLKSMFAAVHESIVDAAHTVEQSTWATINERYFTQNDDGSFDPKTVKMNLPSVGDDGKVAYNPVDVPLFSLSNHQALAIEELTIGFDVDLKGLNNDDSAIMGDLPKGFFKRSATAKIEIKFKGADASEGVMLLNDKIMQTMPR